jgi:hypothetical protein
VIAEKEFLSPGTPLDPGADEFPPDRPAFSVRQGGGPFSAGRSNRRRRSASPLPPPPIPAEMPYDTAGRVVFLAEEPPPDVRSDPDAAPPEDVAPAAAAPWFEGWVAVAVAAAVIVALFLLGMGLTR